MFSHLRPPDLTLPQADGLLILDPHVPKFLQENPNPKLQAVLCRDNSWFGFVTSRSIWAYLASAWLFLHKWYEYPFDPSLLINHLPICQHPFPSWQFSFVSSSSEKTTGNFPHHFDSAPFSRLKNVAPFAETIPPAFWRPAGFPKKNRPLPSFGALFGSVISIPRDQLPYHHSFLIIFGFNSNHNFEMLLSLIGSSDFEHFTIMISWYFYHAPPTSLDSSRMSQISGYFWDSLP